MINRLGPQDLCRELGRGDAGVVYLATVTCLDQQVAIKALPAQLASDAARLERFEPWPASMASRSRMGSRYLELEYVEGESLADRLDRGPLPVDEAVEPAVQDAGRGGSPLHGEIASDSIGAVLHENLDFNAFPPGTPGVACTPAMP